MKRLILTSILLIYYSTLSAAPRVVSLTPAVSEAIIAIGGKKLLCGRSSACIIPEISHLPVAGNLGNPLPEKIFKLKCDLIISDVKHPSRSWLLLQKSPVKVLFLPATRLDDLPGNLRKLGAALDLNSNAEAAAQTLSREITGLRRSIPAHRPKALMLFSTAPAVSCGRDSFITEALSLAGVESITAGLPGSYFTLSREYIIKNAPEYIISADLPENAVRNFFADPLFRNLPAVKNNRFINVDPARFCRPGIKLPGAIRELRQKLQ